MYPHYHSYIRAVKKASEVFGPRNVCVLVNPDDPDSVAIADYYMQKRGIPAENRFHFSFDAEKRLDTWTSLDSNLDYFYRFINELCEFLKGKDISALVMCGQWPFEIKHGIAFDSRLQFPFLLQKDIDGIYVMPPFGIERHLDFRRLVETVSNQGYLLDKVILADIDIHVADSFHNVSSDVRYGLDKDRVQRTVGYEKYFYSGNLSQNTIYGRYLAEVKDSSTVTANGPPGKFTPAGNATYQVFYTKAGTRLVRAYHSKMATASIQRRNFFGYLPEKYNARNTIHPERSITCRYSVWRLACFAPESNDPVNGGKTEADVVKERIDSMLNAEAQGWTDIPGDVASGIYSGDIGRRGTIMAAKKFNAKNVYWRGGSEMNWAAYPNWHPSWITTANNPPGNDNIVPREGQPWTPYNPFWITLGTEAYFNSDKRPIDYGEFNFTDGAIICCSQSCGNAKTTSGNAPVDPFYTQGAYIVGDPNGAEIPVYGDAPAATIYNPRLNENRTNYVLPYYIDDGSNKNATVKIVDNNKLELREDGVLVATLTTTQTTLYGAVRDFYSQLPAGWGFRLKCPGIMSRAQEFFLRGACLTYGASSEPSAHNHATGMSELWNLCHGASAHDMQMNFKTSSAISFNGLTHDTGYLLIWHGDPLYRPFWRNLGKSR